MDCPKCKEEVIDFVLCSDCAGQFHYACAGVAESTYRKMSMEKKATWKCISCRNPENSNSITEILRQLKCMRAEFGAEFNDVKLGIQELNAKWSEMEPRLSNVEDRLDTVEKKVSSFTKLQSELKTANDVITNLVTENNARDQYSRINNLEISGVPVTPGENLHNILLSMCSKIGFDLDVNEVDSVHRVRRFDTSHNNAGGSGSSSVPRPPAIVVKFCKRSTKDAVLAAVRARRGLTTADLQLAGPATAVYVSDHLTPSNKLLLKEARQLKADRDYAYLWIRDCKIFMRKTDSSKVLLISNKADIDKLK